MSQHTAVLFVAITATMVAVSLGWTSYYLITELGASLPGVFVAGVAGSILVVGMAAAHDLLTF